MAFPWHVFVQLGMDRTNQWTRTQLQRDGRKTDAPTLRYTRTQVRHPGAKNEPTPAPERSSSSRSRSHGVRELGVGATHLDCANALGNPPPVFFAETAGGST